MKVVQQAAEGRSLSDDRLRSIAAFCRYAYIGFVMQFLGTTWTMLLMRA